MAALLRCACGTIVSAQPDATGVCGLCPGCQRLLRVAPTWHGMRTRLLLTAAATLLLAVGLGIVLFKTLAPPRREAPPPVAAAPAVPSATETPASPPVAPSNTPVPSKAAVADLDPGLARAEPAPVAEIPPLVLGPRDLLPDPPPLKRPQTLDPPQPKEPAATRPAPAPVVPVVPPVQPPKKRPPAEEMPRLQAKPEKPRPAQPRARLIAGDHFYQELVIGRVSTYSVLGIDLSQNVQYALVSRFDVESREADGSLKVRQKVEGVKLSNADEAMQAQLNALLRKMEGATFHLTLNPRREVTHFEGAKEALQVFTGANALGGQSFLLWSFLDRDGWKELAELSFFQPPDSTTRGAKWSRPTVHSWGPLGHWAGRIVYAAAGKQAGLDRYNYALNIGYQPARGGANGLPFQIDRADFRVQQAGGAILYDPDRKQVSVAEELFHVRGALAVSVLGMPGAVEMDEKQVFRVRILDRNPLRR